MGRFVADPDVIRAKGRELVNHAVVFDENVKKVYQTIQKMIDSDYLSHEAVAIAKEIEGYRIDLDTMTKTINKYGVFCINSSASVVRNQDDIISGI